jgi:hypothetical protein
MLSSKKYTLGGSERRTLYTYILYYQINPFTEGFEPTKAEMFKWKFLVFFFFFFDKVRHILKIFNLDDVTKKYFLHFLMHRDVILE